MVVHVATLREEGGDRYGKCKKMSTYPKKYLKNIYVNMKKLFMKIVST